MKNIITKLSNKVRIIILRLKYDIGKKCTLSGVVFWDCDQNSIKIGNSVNILRNTEICSKSNFPVIIGSNVFVNQRCLIRPNVIIENNVSIGPNVSLMSDSHEIGSSEKRAGKQSFKQIKIGEGVWIGASSTILGGIEIGNGAVIAAGSVVTKSCESNCLYAGVPAKKIKILR